MAFILPILSTRLDNWWILYSISKKAADSSVVYVGFLRTGNMILKRQLKSIRPCGGCAQ